MIEFDDNETDKKIKIFNKGIFWNKNKKIDQWEYRSGSINIPSIKQFKPIPNKIIT